MRRFPTCSLELRYWKMVFCTSKGTLSGWLLPAASATAAAAAGGPASCAAACAAGGEAWEGRGAWKSSSDPASAGPAA